MAVRVFRVAVVGCPRLVITSDPTFSGVGKSCLCNRFVRPEAYTEAHDSTVTAGSWTEKPAYNGDHFLYWGAASKYLGEGAKIRFQVVEQSEFCELVGSGLQRLRPHPSDQEYLLRASRVQVTSQSAGKTAYQTHPEGAYASSSSAASTARTMRSTQLFPNDDFGSKEQGVCAYVCVFDPTLVGEEMARQKEFLTKLLLLISKTKRRVVLACVKCDAVDEGKRRLGSGLANSILKKPIPYIETSAREGINVDEAFFMAATGSVKRKKGAPGGKHPPSVSLTYKEGADAKKQDINQARDAYKRLLARKVNHFSCLWNDVLPILEVEPEYNHLLKVGGVEAREVVKKMFCMRLIELKIKEANEQFRLNTIKKKLDNGQQKAFQSYLSDAFKQHPDMGPDFLADCTPSGRSTPSYAAHTQILDNGSTGGSNTPDQCIGVSGSFNFAPTPRSSNLNLNPLPVTPGSYGQQPAPPLTTPSGDVSTLVPTAPPAIPTASPVIPMGSPAIPVGPPAIPIGPPVGSPAASNSSISSMQHRANQQAFSYGSPVLQRKAASLTVVASPAKCPAPTSSISGSPPSDRQPPPLPSRHSVTSSPGLVILQQQQQQQYAVSQNDAARRSVRSFLGSADCLLGPLPPEPKPELQPEAATEANPIDAEPYLNPRDLGLGPLPPSPAPSPPPRPRGSNQFRSLRLIKAQPRLPLPHTMAPVGDVSRTASLRGHKRSHSNPGLLESSSNQSAQTLPPHLSGAAMLKFGNGGSFAAVGATPTVPSDYIPVNSTADFAHSEVQRVPQAGGSGGTASGGDIDRVGATGDGDSEDDDDGDSGGRCRGDDDNQSELSGPFEEIDERQPPAQQGSGGQTSGATPAKTPNHYAIIEDYMVMRPAEPLLGAEPSPLQQPQNGGEDDAETRKGTFSPFSLVRRQFTKTKKGSSGEVSPPSSAQGNQTSPQDEATPHPPFQEHNLSSSSSLRPLPPSPDKQSHAVSRKASNNNNIYEVIDESWAARQQKGGTGWSTTVDPSLFQQYEEVVKEFFRDPVVTQQWWSAVRKVVPAGDMAGFPPPFFQAPPPPSTQGRDVARTQGVPLLPVMESSGEGGPNADSPTPSGRECAGDPGHMNLNASITRSRDDMIGFINQQLNQSMLSDSDDDQSDGGEECRGEFSDDSEPDSDVEVHAVPAVSVAPTSLGGHAEPSFPYRSSPLSVIPPPSSHLSPSPSLSPPRDASASPKRSLDQPQVSEEHKKSPFGVGWCTDLDLLGTTDQLQSNPSDEAKGQTDISSYQSHALDADDSESEC